MRLGRKSVGLVVSSLFAFGCGGDSSTGPASSLTLSASQATAIMSGITQITALNREIAWLADSANLVLKSGAEATLVPITINTAPGPFYAVGLQRRVQFSGASFSTFDFIAFNNPSNPTDFIIVDGLMNGTTATPPTSVSGDFDYAVNGYVYHLDATTITAWRAALGSGTLSGGSPSNACDGFPAGNGITCALGRLSAAFTITGAFQSAGPASDVIAQAVLSSTSVAGIILSYSFP